MCQRTADQSVASSGNRRGNVRSEWRGTLIRLGGKMASVWLGRPALAGSCTAQRTELCFCRYPVLISSFPAGISNPSCLPWLSKMVHSLLLVRDAQCVNGPGVLPKHHFGFVSGTSSSSLSKDVCLKFETEICTQGTNSLKSKNSN